MAEKSRNYIQTFPWRLIENNAKDLNKRVLEHLQCGTYVVRVGSKLKMSQLMILAKYCFKNAIAFSELLKESYITEDILSN